MYPTIALWFLIYVVKTQVAENRPIEMVLVVEDSRSVNDGDFAKMITVVQNIPDDFRMGKNRTRVAVVVYSWMAKIAVPMTEDEKRIRSFEVKKREMGIPRMDFALKDARALFVNARDGAAKIVIVMSDFLVAGADQELIEKAATDIRDIGAKIYVAAVGDDYERGESKKFAKRISGDASRVYSIGSFMKIKTDIMQQAFGVSTKSADPESWKMNVPDGLRNDGIPTTTTKTAMAVIVAGSIVGALGLIVLISGMIYIIYRYRCTGNRKNKNVDEFYAAAKTLESFVTSKDVQFRAEADPEAPIGLHELSLVGGDGKKRVLFQSTKGECLSAGKIRSIVEVPLAEALETET